MPVLPSLPVFHWEPSQRSAGYAVRKVGGDIARDDGFIGFQRVRIAAAHLGGDLEGDVDQLAEMGVVLRIFLVVAQRGGVGGGVPCSDLRRGGKPGLVNVDDRGVRRGQFREAVHGGANFSASLTSRSSLCRSVR